MTRLDTDPDTKMAIGANAADAAPRCRGFAVEPLCVSPLWASIDFRKRRNAVTIRIRKIDIDDLSGDNPTWGKIRAVVNGVDVQLTLDESQIARVIATATPLAMELIGKIVNASKVVVEMKREPAA